MRNARSWCACAGDCTKSSRTAPYWQRLRLGSPAKARRRHSVYPLVSANHADGSNDLSVRAKCRLLGVSPAITTTGRTGRPAIAAWPVSCSPRPSPRRTTNPTKPTAYAARARRTARGQVQRQPIASCALYAQRLHPRCEPASWLHGGRRGDRRRRPALDLVIDSSTPMHPISCGSLT